MSHPVAGGENYPKLSRQPLSLVLADFRFSKVLKIANYIPDLQEALRREFPEYQEQRTHSINVGPYGPSVGDERTAWVFRDRRRRKAVLVHQGGIVYYSSDYDRFPGFRDECRVAVTAVKNNVDPTELERVGLRYNDLIVPADDRALAYYIDRSLAPPDLGGYTHALEHHRTETYIKTNIGHLAIRSAVGNVSQSVMPDLRHVIPIEIRTDTNPKKCSAILDFDHTWEPERPEDFDPDKAVEVLSSLHADAREAFVDVTTDQARTQEWR